MDKHYIVLNGKRYDAVTGALLGPDAAATSQPTHSKSRTRQTATSVHAPRTATTASVISTPAAAPAQAAPVAKKPPIDRSQHSQAQRLAHHKPQPSKTLMRRAVHKPSTGTLVPVKKHYPIIVTESGIKVEAPKRLAHHIDENRSQRSHTVHKSTQVGRYHAPALAPVKPRVAPIAVREQPAVQPAKTALKPAPHVIKPSTPKKVDIFEQAITAATSHEQKAPKGVLKRRKRVNAVAALASVLVLAGAVAALNQTTIEMQIASMRAGFQANEPRYSPEGFEKSNATVAGKAVALNYTSQQGGYTLTQESSSWDSQTLFDTISATYGDQYDIAYENGRIIYLYGDSEASWVNGGILYKLQGNSSLSNEQIIDIAASL